MLAWTVGSQNRSDDVCNLELGISQYCLFITDSTCHMMMIRSAFVSVTVPRYTT